MVILECIFWCEKVHFIIGRENYTNRNISNMKKSIDALSLISVCVNVFFLNG